MSKIIQLDDISITVTKKNIKKAYLTVHPPDGHVTLSIPTNVRAEVIHTYVISKLAWIRKHQKRLANQIWETTYQFIENESHYVWGNRYLMTVKYKNVTPSVELIGSQIKLTVRPGSNTERRAAIMHEWHKSLLHKTVPPLIQKWESKLNVNISNYFLRRMKTKWGSCNYTVGNIRLNTELVKKPEYLLEYVIVHELAHLIEPSHNKRFTAILDEYYPSWRKAHSDLNKSPQATEIRDG